MSALGVVTSRSLWIATLGLTAATGNTPKEVVLAVCALCASACVGLRASVWLCAAAAALHAYSGGLALPAPGWLGLSLLALVTAAQARTSKALALAHVFVMGALVMPRLVDTAAAASAWPGFFAHQDGQCSAAALGLLAFWLTPKAVSSSPRAAGVVVVLAAGAAWLVPPMLGQASGKAALVARLNELPPRPLPATWALLERMRIAGVSDAGLALVGMAVAENAGASDLRRWCPPAAGDEALGPAWQPWRERGQRACALLRQPWSAGGGAEELRLQAELLFEQGLVSSGIDRFERAAALGDPFARRNAVALLVARRRFEQARAFADTTDPFTTLLQGLGAFDDARLWRALNDALAPRKASASLCGIEPIDAPGTLVLRVLPSGASAWQSDSRYSDRFAVSLPVPPGGVLPGVIELAAVTRRHLELGFVSQSGSRLTYTCRAFAPRSGERVVPLPASLCQNAGLVRLTPLADWPEHRAPDLITAFELRGSYSLSVLRLYPLVLAR